jgi:hypothetical protein
MILEDTRVVYVSMVKKAKIDAQASTTSTLMLMYTWRTVPRYNFADKTPIIPLQPKSLHQGSRACEADMQGGQSLRGPKADNVAMWRHTTDRRLAREQRSEKAHTRTKRLAHKYPY